MMILLNGCGRNRVIVKPEVVKVPVPTFISLDEKLTKDCEIIYHNRANPTYNDLKILAKKQREATELCNKQLEEVRKINEQ